MEESTERSPFEAFWEHLLDDVEEVETEYREAGWDVHSLVPGEVTALYDTEKHGSEKSFGLSVLLQDRQFETIESLVDRISFDSSEVYSRTSGSIVFLLLVERSTEAETAVLIPAYYNHVTDEGLLEEAKEAGEMRVHVRSLSSDGRILFHHDDPSLFAPDVEE